MMDLGSAGLVALDCSPEVKETMLSRKRKASQVLEKGSPLTTIAFLKWRLAVVLAELDINL